MAMQDIKIGDKFNRLTILAVLDEKSSGYHRYAKCRCDCGKIITARLDLIASGNTKSCGCYQKEAASKANTAEMIGKKFGMLTVIDRYWDHDPGQCIKYLCRCDCGHHAIISGRDLRAGRTVSCGCARKLRWARR